MKHKSILRTRLLRGLLIALMSLAGSWGLRAQSPTAFTYQGQLNNSGSPANGNYDFTFQLFDAGSNGNSVGPILTNSATPVSNGLFTVTLDYGSAYFQSPTNYWLAVSVQPTQGSNGFVQLSPLQWLGSTPQSIFALSAGTAASSSNFSGSITGDVTGSQGTTVVASVGGQTAASIASGVIAANAASSSNVLGSIVARDPSGSFAAGSITLSSNLYLPFPAIIYSGTNALLTEEGSLFLGQAAGAHQPINPDEFNVGVGDYALYSDTTGSNNTAGGEYSLYSNTTGSDNKADGYKTLYSNTTGSDNTANGAFALYANTTASANTASGFEALNQNTTGSLNTADGAQALQNNTTGTANTASGYVALEYNTTGNENTANGAGALQANSTGDANTANGYQALEFNTSGSYNAANGFQALNQNTTGSQNTANGYQALLSNTSGPENTATGVQALSANSTGAGNVANGYQALNANTSGNYNTGDGLWAMLANTTGGANTAVGYNSLTANTSGSGNVAVGVHNLKSITAGNDNTSIGYAAFGTLSSVASFTNGNNDIALGYLAGANLASGSDDIYIGNQGTGENFTGVENEAIRLGTFNNVSNNGVYTNTYIAGIWDTTLTTSNLFVVVDSGGHLGTSTAGNTGPGVSTSSIVGINHIVVTPFAGGVDVGSDATPADTFSTIVSRDANGSFNANNIALGVAVNGSQNGVLNLPLTTSTAGMITLGGTGNSFLHAYGSQNFFGGVNAGNFTLSGSGNAGVGYLALANLTTGFNNTADGAQSLQYNTTGSGNTANGYVALSQNSTGSQNTATGAGALQGNTTGNNNTANGYQALLANTSGVENTATGVQSLVANTTGVANTANGYQSLNANITGSYNTADGLWALRENTNGANNVAVGYNSLTENLSGSGNVVVGVHCFLGATSSSNNTSIGYAAFGATGTVPNLTSGYNDIALGYLAGANLVSGTNDIYIGNPGDGTNFSSTESGIIRIGTDGQQTQTFLAGTVYANGTFVSSSDRNIKDHFQSLNTREVLEKVAAMPVSRWNYKKDPTSQHIGPMAQDFYAAFNVGPDDKHITTVDEGGVALAAIQGLNEKLVTELRGKDAKIQDLTARLNELEAAVKSITDKQ